MHPPILRVHIKKDQQRTYQMMLMRCLYPPAYEVCNGGIYFLSFLCVCVSVSLSVNIYFVSDISETTLPRNLKFCTHDKYD